ncbi:Hypothetical protein PHPALM_678 [Phytophthora palmivora]|uniref:Uncharacterized protein n=1 Tax=Phytophthora palmivora TaxID=4796 RepID=A0A2P4YU81_9STRA|nr:Hypothetical protein PHPALM_678 [Phytophthora palmivora]
MDGDTPATPATCGQTTQNPSTTDGEDEEEMPLLFMDELPSNFRQNSQLAAIATFMADSDDDEAGGDQQGASETGNSSKQRRQRLQQSTRTRRRQQPYAKPLAKGKNPPTRRIRNETKPTDTKELQLFLSMFHVS